MCGTLTASRDENRHPELTRRLIHLPSPDELGQDTPAGPAVTDDLLDALLEAGGSAVPAGDAGRRLARTVTETVLPLRPDSRPAWRLRARALEAAGDTEGALAAYDRCVALAAHDTHARTRATALRTALPEERALAALLPGAGVPPRGPGTVPALEAAAVRHIEEHLATAAAGSPALAEVIALYADQHRHRLRAPIADPTYGGTGWLDLGGLRNRIAGRSICLVANSGTVKDGSLGALIDSYDVVVRFTSYVIDPAATGTRTDIHVTGHRKVFNWDRPVTTRLVLGDSAAAWRTDVRARLVPGAQRYAGDESLRAPVRDIGRLDEGRWPHPPTCSFEAMWLLDFLDVSPRLDLVGFDFHRTPPYRLPGAALIPTASDEANTRQEAWVMERARNIAGPVVSLR
ncbi:hypothetical protein RVR_4065 [Actinacidiphila reveromycinica]|uniref:Uncharacterized protein n=1 Tax=Actinacidiphila reveromycinica TaxID=659352 RepID=A0A7U3USN8_9ACTN|nr:glycosyltransferase family 29 protein [Streptomyces sp. SN-593]BBA98036.1 hypothetical protein RVR_4065 [Streptomyces sp. SN-593]